MTSAGGERGVADPGQRDAAPIIASPSGIGGSGATGATTAAGRRVATPGFKTDASSDGERGARSLEGSRSREARGEGNGPPPSAAPLCPCHGEPTYRRVNGRGVADWQCGVKKREYQRRRYDADPFYRITKNLHDQARRRRATLDRREQAMTPTEGGTS